MKRYLICFACLSALFMTACNTILEFPEENGVDPTLVNVNLNFEVDPKIEPFISSKADGASLEDYDVRWIVEVFKDGITGEPVERKIITTEPSNDGRHFMSMPVALNAAKYYAVAWMDYVDNSSLTDKYYMVPSLSSIKVLENKDYIGDNDFKDAYSVAQEVDLTPYREQWDVTVDRAVTLNRPMAKIQIITTDIDRFIKDLEVKKTAGKKIADNLLTKNPDLASITVELQYAGYFPSGFNVYTNKPNDARTGVTFRCNMTPLQGNEARLASDYIFVNGSESAVRVNLIIRDSDGNLLNEVGDINVPIVRGKLTTIKDEFLTKDFAPGIGIDPGFDGQFDIVIPD